MSCKYCEGRYYNEKIYGNDYGDQEVEIYENKLDIDIEGVRLQIPINYCPMCGDKISSTDGWAGERLRMKAEESE